MIITTVLMLAQLTIKIKALDVEVNVTAKNFSRAFLKQ